MATKPTYTPVFEETETDIKDRMLERVAAKGWRTEQGDFIYDAVAAAPLEVKQLQVNQDTILKSAFPQFAEGEYMDEHLVEIGLERIQATPNKRILHITADAGVIIPQGHTASVVILDSNGNPLQFELDESANFDTAGTLEVPITCRTAGAITNVPLGTQFILLPPIPGVRTIVDGGTTVAGGDTESDADAWERYLFRVSNEDTGGNKNDYVRWAQERPGVGKAKCIPRWDGNGTVKLLIVGADFTPATPTVVAELQEFIDPGARGLGEGRAPCGASVTVEAAQGLPITVTATVVLENGYTLSQVETAFSAALADYLKGLVFNINSATGVNYPISYNQIGAKLITTEGVMNYGDLLVNGGVADIPIDEMQAPVVGTVTLL